MLFNKLIKVQNLTCSKLKYDKTILMLCNKIEINKAERFSQARMGIHILSLLSVSYIQKKPSFNSVTQIYKNLEISYHSNRQEENFKKI